MSDTQTAPSTPTHAHSMSVNRKCAATMARWTEDEDRALAASAYASLPWTETALLVSRLHPACPKTPKQCCQRWQRVLNPAIRKGHWTKEEEILLQRAVERLGTRAWAEISKEIPGRTGLQCRTRWVQSQQRMGNTRSYHTANTPYTRHNPISSLSSSPSHEYARMISVHQDPSFSPTQENMNIHFASHSDIRTHTSFSAAISTIPSISSIPASIPALISGSISTPTSNPASDSNPASVSERWSHLVHASRVMLTPALQPPPLYASQIRLPELRLDNELEESQHPLETYSSSKSSISSRSNDQDSESGSRSLHKLALGWILN